MQEEGQKTGEGDPDDMMSDAPGQPMRTGSAGTSGGGAAGGGGTQARGGNAPASGSGGGSMTNGMAGKADAGTSGTMMSGAGTGSQMPSVKVVPACMGRAGERICDGAKMIKCGEMFDAAETMPCQSEARCNAGLSTGSCGKCDPGAVKCMEAELFECSMMGEMVLKEPCGSSALCDEIGKRCEPPKCEKEEHNCEGGLLRSCKEDLTGWNTLSACAPELCDAEGKKCNKCLPGLVKCMSDSALTTCAEDGSMETEMACPTATPICSMDKCVQCLTDDMCKPMSDCQKSSCMNGMCTPVQNLPIETACSSNGGKVCSIAGTCVACNSDLSCSPSQRCSVVFGCIERQALTVSSLIPGTYTVQVNAGWGLEIASHTFGEKVSVSAIGLSTTGADTGRILMGSEATQRIITFRAIAPAAGVGGGGLVPSLGRTCYANPFTDTSATLNFTHGMKDVIMNDDGTTTTVPAGTCGEVRVSIRAVQ